MKCAPFDYVRAGSVEEAVSALDAAGGDGKILAGGQSLVPLLAMRMARPTVLVDVNRIPGLATIRPDDGAVLVGALVRHAALVEQTAHPLLAEAARWIGHAAIRTRGTAGGSLAHADPAAEMPVVAVATGAEVLVAGAAGSRTDKADQFFLGPLTTSLDDAELITGLRFPVPRRWGFAEFARRHGDFALVTAVVTEMEDGVRVVVGGVASVPWRSAAAESVFSGGGSAAAVAAALAEEIEPTGDLHGSARFRRALAAEMVTRALTSAGMN